MKHIVLSVNDILKTLFSVSGLKKIEVSFIYLFYSYLRRRIEEDGKIYVFSSEFENIERFVSNNSEVYDLINEEVIVAKGIVEKSLDNKWLVEVCREFLFHYFQAD